MDFKIGEMTNGAKSGQNETRAASASRTWVAEGRLCSTGPMSTACKKHVSPIYPVRDSSWVIGNVSPLLGYLVTAESADDAALSVMPWLRVAKAQRYAVSAGNVEMMELVAGGSLFESSHSIQPCAAKWVGQKSLKRFSAVLWITLLSPAETLLCALPLGP